MEFSPVYWLSNGSLVPSAISERNKNPEAEMDSATLPSTEATTLSVAKASENELQPEVQIQDLGPILSGPDSLENLLLNPPVSNEIMVEQPDNLAEDNEKTLLASIGMIAGAENSAFCRRSFTLSALLLLTTVLDILWRRVQSL